MSSLNYHVQTWGTVILIELSSQKVSEEKLLLAAKEAQEFLLKLDSLFSTYRNDSQVSALRAGELDIKDADILLRQVWDRCLQARELTGGAFDPWKVEGGFDPSGFVKGWAADKCGELFEKYGVESKANCACEVYFLPLELNEMRVENTVK